MISSSTSSPLSNDECELKDQLFSLFKLALDAYKQHDQYFQKLKSSIANYDRKMQEIQSYLAYLSTERPNPAEIMCHLQQLTDSIEEMKREEKQESLSTHQEAISSIQSSPVSIPSKNHPFD